jgi:putative SOS response-associated peptidase YedK
MRLNPEGRRELVNLRWGLIPSWARDEKIAYKLINARSETIAEKPAFRDAFRSRRCLVPVDGFYEWQKTAGGKEPYYIRFRDEHPFLIAGLWERWLSPVGEHIETCTLITTGANELLRPIHDRMPVIIPKEEIDAWLNPKAEGPDALASLFAPSQSKEMVAIRVSTRINNPRNDDISCLAAA